ncbi:MAG: Na/Pi cotransporter family protein, partial [Erysipelotrichaceae bacterium]|nr:Na/Pi cotransporter family protein [Erysipelotrichaceae bacterium]
MYYPVDAIVHLGWDSIVVNPFSIALINSVYRIITMTMLLPFYKLIEKIVFKFYPVTKEEKESAADFDKLEERFLTNPRVAYEQSMIVMNGMAKNAKKNFDRAWKLLENYSDSGYKRVENLEQTLNKYEDKLGNYLVQLMSTGVSLEQGKMINKSLQAIADFEKIGDYALNIADVAKNMNNKKLRFSIHAIDELTVVGTAASEIIDITVNSFINNDPKKVKRVFPLKELITIDCNEIKKRHVLRLKSGECEMEKGFELNDLLNDMARIADHCASLALDIIKEEEQDFNAHRFLRKYQEEEVNKDSYSSLLHHYEEKYSIDGITPTDAPVAENA